MLASHKSPLPDRLLAIIDAAYDRKSWHGTNLRGSIRGMTARQASWRPSPQRHNIWELVVHAAYWKYVVYRRLTSAPRGSFPREGSNWFVRGNRADDRAWRSDVALLDETHRSLRSAIAILTPSDLNRKPASSKLSNFEIIAGIAAHDLYHAGQIQLLKRLQRK
jgi:hypothetical protein